MKATNQFGRSAYASTILLPHTSPNTFFEKLQFNLVTKIRLSQFKNQFLDFSPAGFPAVAVRIYSELATAFKANDRATLTKLLTIPYLEVIRTCQRQQIPLPFTIFPKATSAQIILANICPDTDDARFAQLAVVLKCLNADGVAKEQLSVFERKLNVKELEAWKITWLEDR